jgi:predicted NBD/HSP70 family sugar kinase
MNIDEALRGLGETLREQAVDVEAGRRRLREAARRLREDPVEARRIDNLAKLVDRDEKDYRRGYDALRRQDFDEAEHYLRRAAQHGSDEAAYWLGQLLEMRSLRQRLKGHPDKAGKLAAEAREWRRRACESGIAEALEEPPSSDTVPEPEPAQPKEARQAHGQPAPRTRKDATVPPARQVPCGGEDCYAVGIELQPYQFTVVLLSQAGEIISDETHALSGMEPGAVVRVLTAAALKIVASTLGHEFPAYRVVLGVQLGGPVDTKAGTVHFFSKHPPSCPGAPGEFKWEDFPLGPRLEQETGFQTVILNDTVAFAERERWTGVGQQTGDFVVMLIREGVGGAVVTDGEHFKGPVEIGNFRYSSANFNLSDADQYGVLELDAGTTGISKNAGDLAGRTIADIETAAAVADEDGPGQAAAGAFLSAGVAIARGLSYLVQFAAPTHVVLYAPDVLLRPDSRPGRRLLGQVKNFREAVAFEAYRHCELVLRSAGRTDGGEGAALAALNRCLRIEPTMMPVSTGA